jgi:hypothetical protein
MYLSTVSAAASAGGALDPLTLPAAEAVAVAAAVVAELHAHAHLSTAPPSCR